MLAALALDILGSRGRWQRVAGSWAAPQIRAAFRAGEGRGPTSMGTGPLHGAIGGRHGVLGAALEGGRSRVVQMGAYTRYRYQNPLAHKDGGRDADKETDAETETETE